MKRTTFYKLVLISFLSTPIITLSQNIIPFKPVFNQNLKGDIAIIGNNILGPNNNSFNDTTEFNSNLDMKYIDIDEDQSTFSSSSADLMIAGYEPPTIKYAALYWGAIERDTDHDFTSVKFKGPAGDYVAINGTVIYDRTNHTGTEIGQSLPYACFADVTDIITGFATKNGSYTVANVSSRVGFNQGTGQAAGWSLFIVYEDPSYTAKSITSFHGFSSVSAFEPSSSIDITGFETVSAPAVVNAKFAFASLEGDSPIMGDQILINDTPIVANERPVEDFFNSSITQLNGQSVLDRNPSSINTLGYDTGITAIPNPDNTVIENGDLSITAELKSSGDSYFPFFFAFSVDINDDVLHITESEKLLKTIKTYPNPVNNEIHINNPNSILLDSIFIYSTTGKLLNSHIKNRAQLKETLDVSNLKPGVYVIIIESEKGTIVKQFTKR